MLPNLRYCLDYSKRKGKKGQQQFIGTRKCIHGRILYTRNMHIFRIMCQLYRNHFVQDRRRYENFINCSALIKMPARMHQGKNITLNLCLLNDMDHGTELLLILNAYEMEIWSLSILKSLNSKWCPFKYEKPQTKNPRANRWAKILMLKSVERIELDNF